MTTPIVEAPEALPHVTSIGSANATAIIAFVFFVGITLGITYWAARKTRSTAEFFAAGGKISALQNGFALAGDFMSAASFLGIAGIVATSGFDGLVYSVGWLVGWPVMTFLIAEPLRNLGQYTFADVVASRMRPRPVRISAAVNTLVVVAFYLIAQMVGAGNLIQLMFGIDYKLAVAVVGGVMLLYVLFGGMIATTWVQIIKAILLMSGALLLAILVLVKTGGLGGLFDAARAKYGDGFLGPGKLVATPVARFDTISLGLALMFGTAGLPHILMRFYTVPDAATARRSVLYATSLIGLFYLVTFVLGFGAAVIVGQEAIHKVDPGNNMAAPLLAEALGGTGFLGVIAAIAFATILAVVAGLTLSGAAALSHDLWGHVIKDGDVEPGEQLRVARYATIGLAVLAILLGIAFQGQNVAFMVGLAFAIAASANFPTLLLAMTWKRFTTRGAVASMTLGMLSSVTLIALSPTVWEKLFGNPAGSAPVPFTNPAIFTIPGSVLVAIVVSLAWPEPESAAKFAASRRRRLLGPDA